MPVAHRKDDLILLMWWFAPVSSWTVVARKDIAQLLNSTEADSPIGMNREHIKPYGNCFMREGTSRGANCVHGV